MRTTQRAPERTTAPFGGPSGCLLRGTPFMVRVLPLERGPRGGVAPLLLGASQRPGCLRFERRMRFRSRDVSIWAPWLNVRSAAGPEQVVEEPHEGRHEQGGALRPGDGNALGRELPENHVQKGYGGEGDGEGDGVG